ncbi:MAG: flavoprotein [Myxococcaceae bacterium]
MSKLQPTQLYVRDSSFAVLSRGEQVICCRANGELVEISPVDVEWLAAALAKAVLPVPGKALAQGASAEQTRTLSALLDQGVIVPAQKPRPRTKPTKPCRHLVLGISGAVQAIHASTLALPLLYGFCDRLDIILTDAARKFVVPEALAYFGMGVWTDAHTSVGEAKVPHVELANSAELVLIAPASAHAVSRLAAGACSDLLSLVVAATEAPVVIAPAMNATMWCKPAIARNVARLRADGFFVVEPSTGLETSSGANPAPELGGMGLTPQTLIPALLTALSLSRRGARGSRR